MLPSADEDLKRAPTEQGAPVPGRPAAFLLLGLPVFLFWLITWQVATDGPLVRVDRRVSHALVHPDRFCHFLSDLGSVEVAVPVLAVVLGYVAVQGRQADAARWWLPPVAAAVLMALVPALIVPLKETIARYGPPTMPPAAGYYPSGHTATATIAYGAATLVLLPWLPSDHARRELVVTCVAVNVGVGFGLVRSGYHWPLDVVASWCLCTVLLTGLALVIRLSTDPGQGPSGTPD
ncbi:phosphatase PAP2 family protein [Streptomyces sp. NPDC046805]|uniref:phosphatase PAP2 family protein n=1 Tax=Streptomyces sp. NPDC046805 TaxID=3155134 RepID=UPI0033DAEB27